MAGGDNPVSWFLIEPGWEVLDADGEHVGRVEETIGDSTHDIFDGISIAPGVFGSARYVPSEQVGEITEGHVRLKLTKHELEHLDELEESPPSAELDSGRWWRRVLVRARTLLRLRR